jgi:hypothetical protein
MITTEIRSSLQKTLSELKIAEREMDRPIEDVMTLSICYTARNSMENLMHAYLSSKNKENDKDKDKGLQDLLAKCREIDPKFKKISLKKIRCTGLSHSQCQDKYCLEHKTVAHCMAVANELKALVLKELELNEHDLV